MVRAGGFVMGVLKTLAKCQAFLDAIVEDANPHRWADWLCNSIEALDNYAQAQPDVDSAEILYIIRDFTNDRLAGAPNKFAPPHAEER
jgi:hypothetical protein